jgi:hypothetical protein
MTHMQCRADRTRAQAERIAEAHGHSLRPWHRHPFYGWQSSCKRCPEMAFASGYGVSGEALKRDCTGRTAGRPKRD